MLGKKELERFGPLGFSLGQKEKDYFQHWILAYLSRSGFAGVFKGGTCLEKAYNLPRYSEDLDFTSDGAEIDGEKFVDFLSKAGFGNPTLKKHEAKNSAAYKARCQGPLYVGNTVSEVSVRIEISRREKLAFKPTAINIKSPYGDVLPYNLLCMDKREMAAEKIRAIYYRNLPRDLYDLYFLCRQDAVPHVDIVNEKLSYYKFTFDKAEFDKKVDEIENKWKKEISLLSPQFIDFKEVSETVKQETRKLQ